MANSRDPRMAKAYDKKSIYYHCVSLKKLLSQEEQALMQPLENSLIEQSKKGCKDQESIQSSTTPDPGYQRESDKLTEDTTNKSQEVSPFPASDHKAHINRRAQRHSKHKTE